MKKERNIFMTKLWDTLKNKTKTLHELVKEFPNKTYKELEKYRNADRNEEAQRIFIQQENEELKDDQLTESERKQAELEPIEGEEQDNPELFEWKERYEKEHKLRQEAETETILVKGIGMNSPEMKAANKRIKELEKQVEDLTNPVQKARESGL
jgi:hypothetical protein